MTGKSGLLALLRNSRTTDSPIAAKSAEFLFHLAPRLAACAVVSNRPQNGAWIAAFGLAIASLHRGPRSALCGLVSVMLLGAQTPSQNVKTVRDGVYTTAQAMRGESAGGAAQRLRTAVEALRGLASAIDDEDVWAGPSGAPALS